MIRERFCLFYAGFTAYAPKTYFGQLSLMEEMKAEGLVSDSTELGRISTTLPDMGEEKDTHLRTAISIAEYFELPAGQLPSDGSKYEEWLNEYTSAFEMQFPMSRIDHYYFLYARKISEVLSNTRLAEIYIGLLLDGSSRPDFIARVDKLLKDTEYVIFKLVAAAALLSSEPRHNYFNVFYKGMNEKFQPIRQVNVNELDTEGLRSFRTQISDFHAGVMDGFKKCIGLLKELNS